MKVILISKVANCGNIGEVVNVKDGYAKNFLIPTQKAIHYSKANYKVFEDQKKEFEAKNQEAINAANETKKLISGKEIVIIENASDDGRLYGAVNTGVITVKVNEISKDLNIAKADVTLEKPIKETGVYEVSVNLYADIVAKINLVVARNESEIVTVVKKAKEDAAQLRKDRNEAQEEKSADANEADAQQDDAQQDDAQQDDVAQATAENKEKQIAATS